MKKGEPEHRDGMSIATGQTRLAVYKLAAMTRLFRTRLLVVGLFLLVVSACSIGLWRYAYVQALGQIEKQGQADLALATDRFTSELRRFRELAVFLADHPAFDALNSEAELESAFNVLRAAADKSGALALYYADADGRVLAQTGEFELVPRHSAYFQRALQGALGTYFGRLGPEDRRVYAYAAPTFAANGQVRGSLIALVDMAEVEWDWIGTQPPVFFTDGNDRVFLSNRSDILGWQKRGTAFPLAPEAGPAPRFARRDIDGFDIWSMEWGDYLPEIAVHLERPVPVIGMTAHALIDTAASRRIAWLQTTVFALLCTGFGAVVLLLAERRRSLAKANQLLETRVTERTAELSQANTALRYEVRERQEAEAALKRAQDDLIQAGKLTALGQMSAGISHELNQPLMAIQQFADNGSAFLSKGKTEPAGENLSRISQLAARAARIIKNLRAFARNENEPMGKVDLVQVLDTAVELTEARLVAENVKLDWRRPELPIYALGGEVRLAQVFVNLINNAVDAMAAQSDKNVTIRVEHDARLTVTVRDTGPGIAAPDKIFDPFYTTKDVGGEDGMGLGLSISYGLVQSFGGNINGSNAPDGGALFRVELEPWAEDVAA